MQEACKKCGYESPEADKFCRQCGDQLSAETEFTAAVTLNHGKVEPQKPMASVGTGRLAPSIGDTIAGDTERYYSPPQYAAAQANIERPQAYVERPQAYVERP
ncbi:MAG TPA: zinc ribbon domain-containing protein, partial [Blastocatellia bacterium]|nr:zinc ribbon domain-containing protein [Blastocatellia bacterium]